MPASVAREHDELRATIDGGCHPRETHCPLQIEVGDPARGDAPGWSSRH